MRTKLIIFGAVMAGVVVLSSALAYFFLLQPVNTDRVVIFTRGGNPSISAEGRNVVVVAEAGNILIAASRDGGDTWNHFELQTAHSVDCPGVCLSNGTVHMAWYEQVSSHYYCITYSKSQDIGKSWSPARYIAAAAFPQVGDMSIFADGNYVHIAFLLGHGNSGEVGYIRSLDGGDSWRQSITMSNPDTKESKDPRLCGTPGNLYYVWFDYGNLTGSMFRYSRDNGDTWSSERQVIFGVFTTIGAHDGTVVVAANILQAPYFTKSTDGGLTWTGEKKFGEYEGYKNAINVVSDDIYIFSCELYKDGMDYLFYSYTRDGGLSWKEEWIRATDDIEHTQSAIAHSDTRIFVVWEDTGIHLQKLDINSL